MTKIRPGIVYLAFVLLFPVFALIIVGSEHAGEVCARVMSGDSDTAKFWYEIPCSPDVRASGWLFGYVCAFVIAGMYAGIVFPIAMGVSGVVVERLAPNKAVRVEWIVACVLVATPVVVMLVAFS